LQDLFDIRQVGEGFSTEDKSQLLYQRGLAHLINFLKK